MPYHKVKLFCSKLGAQFNKIIFDNGIHKERRNIKGLLHGHAFRTLNVAVIFRKTNYFNFVNIKNLKINLCTTTYVNAQAYLYY